MLTRNERRIITSLATAKGRKEHRCFVAEGTKCVLETLSEFHLHRLLATREWIDNNAGNIPADTDIEEVKRADILEISSLATPADVMAIYHIPETRFVTPSSDSLSLALDCIQDPGNLGTIIRISAWMGIHDIYCSRDTVDVYNPKVVQATMGALGRVRVHYCDLQELLMQARHDSVETYGTFLDGEILYDCNLTPGGIIVMGNEGKGVSAPVAAHINNRLYIPSFPPFQPAAIESLNVAVATAITVGEFRRRSL